MNALPMWIFGSVFVKVRHNCLHCDTDNFHMTFRAYICKRVPYFSPHVSFLHYFFLFSSAVLCLFLWEVYMCVCL